MLKLRALAVPLLAAALAAAAPTVTPGARPPAEVLARARPSLEAGRRALAAGDESAVRAAVANSIAALGAWAGNPEAATPHFPPPDRTPFDAAKVRAIWLREIDRGGSGVPWRKNAGGDPRRMRAGLREAALPLSAFARSAALFPDRAGELADAARAGADWLLARQHSSGVFPMPIGPGLEPREKVGFIVQRLMKEHPELVADGWIVSVPGDGGLQFDNGLCGAALVDAWELTHDARYLASARRAADWAIAQPLVTNWNYNAFSAGLLARVARATGEAKYLDAAVEKARVGVLPGQMTSGRWFDAHNACAVYHNILLRDLLEVFGALPEQHAFRAGLRDALTRGLDQAADETLAEGFTGVWTANFARALVLLGENAKWRDALNVCVNSAIGGMARDLGFDAVRVLEFSAR